MPLTAGTKVGPYEVVSLLGVGGMGEVYRARDSRLGRDVALKVLPELFAADSDRLARFQREAQVLAALNHPHIAGIYGLEESPVDVGAGLPGGSRPILALVLELVDGETLADRIARGPIPWDEALPIAKQIAAALEAAHEQGVIHRDLKPANIKVTPEGVVKVLDFGLAKLADAGPATAGPHVGVDMTASPTITSPAMMTGVGTLLGTAAYMAPEQAKGRTADKRSDIWAFGCVLYEMLTGRRAFAGDDVADTLAAVLRGEPDWITLAPPTRSHVQSLLHRCLEKDPKQRWQAIGDVRYELDAILKGPSEAARPAPSFSRWAKAASLILAVAVGAFLAAAFGARLENDPVPVGVPPVRFTVQPNWVFFNPEVSEIAVSPDGRNLAYTARSEDGKKVIWIRDLVSGAVRSLPATEGAWYPFWSPDGGFIGFYAERKLKKAAVTGGPAEVIAELPGGSVAATWRADGTIVFGGAGRSLSQVAASGGSPTPVIALDTARGERSHLFPQFLPDGDHLLYFVATDNPEWRGVYLRSLQSGTSRRVLASDLPAVFAVPSHLITVRVADQTLLAYPFDLEALEVSGNPVPLGTAAGRSIFGGVDYASVSASSNGIIAYGGVGLGEVEPVWRDRSGLRIGTLGSVEPFLQVRLSPDETRALFLKRDQKTNTNDVWVANLASRVFTKISSEGGDPIWSPDGRSVAFYKRTGIYVKVLGEDRETRLAAQGNVEDWTKDGQALVARRNGVISLPVDGTTPPAVLLPVAEKPVERNEFQLSPDGKWIAFTEVESGQGQVWVASFPTFTQRRQVSNGGGDVPRWRNDQRELFYLAPNGDVMSVDVTAASEFDAGTPRILFSGRTIPNGGFDQYAVTGDGQRFLLLETPESAAPPPITVIANWTSLLK